MALPTLLRLLRSTRATRSTSNSTARAALRASSRLRRGVEARCVRHLRHRAVLRPARATTAHLPSRADQRATLHDQLPRKEPVMRMFLASVASALVLAVGAMYSFDIVLQRRADQAFASPTSVRTPSHGMT